MVLQEKASGGRGGDVMSTKRNKISDSKHCPENLYGNLCCVHSCPQLDRAIDGKLVIRFQIPSCVAGTLL